MNEVQKNNKLTQKYLKECINYNKRTGLFKWKTRPIDHFIDFKIRTQQQIFNNWNNRFANKVCGTYDKYGYHIINIDNKSYKAHRLAFLYVKGYMPENFVDHKDGNKDNNIWCNLREVVHSCNMQNCKLSKNNKSGVTGVSFYNKLGKYVAEIIINYKKKYIGCYINFDDAVKARYNEEINNPEWSCYINSDAYNYLKIRKLI